MDNETVQLKDLCESEGVAIQATLVRRPLFVSKALKVLGPDSWKDTAFHWLCILRYDGRTHTTDYWCGAAHCQNYKHNPKTMHDTEWNAKARPIPPSAADVLYSLCLDSSAMDETFEDWCANSGYDTDSRRALDTYMQCQKIGKDMQKFLGSKFDEFRQAEH